MVCCTGIRRNSKRNKLKAIKNRKILENPDHPRPERTRFIEEKEEEFRSDKQMILVYYVFLEHRGDVSFVISKDSVIS